ncbi:MAG: hypothetical protein AB8B82_17055 [Roseovarius sp.]
MTSYRPDKFANTFHHAGGAAIWAFLHRPDIMLRMETACYLRRPAVEPIALALLAEFGGAITQRRIKQMIGHMVRQILELKGYRLQHSAVRITRAGNPFFSGSRYDLLPQVA